MVARLCWVLVVVIASIIFTEHVVECDCPPGRTTLNCDKYNFAYLKPANQKEEWVSHSAHFAVDHNITTCSVTVPPVDNPWWSVDLQKNMYIDGLYITFTSKTGSDVSDFIVEVQAITDVVNEQWGPWTTCYEHTAADTMRNPFPVTCSQRMTARKIRITAFHNATVLSICDLGAYGACIAGSYGNYCEEECGNCNLNQPICDVTTGRCPSGCDTGYHGNVCKEKCPFGKYGQACASTCGNCLYNVTCNVYDGSCPGKNCEPGYQAPDCRLVCPDHKWGIGCINCGACINDENCSKFNGSCANGCSPGYEYSYANQMCTTECEDGDWGDECGEDCGNCYVPGQQYAGPCDKVTGTCDNGCAPGYKQTTSCKEECAKGKWGMNCLQDCGGCIFKYNETTPEVNVTCLNTDGVCQTGCYIGLQGTRCDRPCSAGFYGQECRSICGHCKDKVACDIVSGDCPGGQCDDGFIEGNCTQECAIGLCGYNCGTTCPVNCDSNCRTTDCSCVCKAGWMGTNCDQVCPKSHYGPDCKLQCGNCKPGTTCRQMDGFCLAGCAAEWNGLKCDSKVIIEEYEKSYGDVIGGAIGGTIALGLIIAFAVWIVWRYKMDKSIHIKALASSLRQSFRRMSLRGRNSLRRSVQRLSMRGRKQNDQKSLGKNAEGPSMSNGKRGHHKSPRMYECVKIQSNTIYANDFSRVYLQLQEATADGRTLLHDAFQSFLEQRPKHHDTQQNGGKSNSAYFGVGTDDVEVHIDSEGNSRIPAFLPLGANLSGFLLVNETAESERLWNHLQQRQIETIISMGKEASYSWRPGERIVIGANIVECIDVQLHSSHRETKLTVQKNGSAGRRAVRHMELYFWMADDVYPHASTLLMFVDVFQKLHSTQRERSILVNYLNMHEQAILFTLVASGIEILTESNRVDILRTVAIAGKPTDKAIRSFEGFKYLHDVMFQYLASKEANTRNPGQQYAGAAAAAPRQPTNTAKLAVQQNSRSNQPGNTRQGQGQRPYQGQPRSGGQEPRGAERSSPGHRPGQQGYNQGHSTQQGHRGDTDRYRDRPAESRQPESRQPQTQSSNKQADRSFQPIAVPQAQPAQQRNYPNDNQSFQPISLHTAEEDGLPSYESAARPKQYEHDYTSLAPASQQRQPQKPPRHSSHDQGPSSQSQQPRSYPNTQRSQPQQQRSYPSEQRSHPGEQRSVDQQQPQRSYPGGEQRSQPGEQRSHPGEQRSYPSNNRGQAQQQSHPGDQRAASQARSKSSSDNYRDADDIEEDDEGGFKSKPRFHSTSTII